MRVPSPLTRLLPAWIAGMLLFGPTPTLAHADLAAGSFVFDGPVSAVAHDAATGKTYLGGVFSQEQAVTGGGISLSATGSGSIDPSTFPHLSGTVSATVSDGQGGWYVGGDFAVVGGKQNLIHVTSTGGLDASFAPNPSGGGFGQVVSALARAGSTLYVGGAFNSLGGQARAGLAAIDTTTGAVTSWNPNSPAGGGFVNALATSGSTLYVGGGFGALGGQTRHNLAAVDVGTGAITAWDPNADQLVTALTVSGSTVYVGGSFSTVGGQTRKSLAAVDSATGIATAWNPSSAFNQISALTISGSTVYVGGHFSTLGGESRHNLAALDASTGNATSWDPGPDDSVSSIAISGGTVYVGGSFSSVGGQSRANAAALDASTGSATAWDPNLNGAVGELAVAGGTVYVGGSFSGAGSALSQTAGLARLNADGSLDTSWHPNPVSGGGVRGNVRALLLTSGRLYVGGGFTTIGGQSRTNLAAVDASTGAVSIWTANATGGDVFALAASDSTLLVGGRFTSLGGQGRSGLGAADTSSGSATSWNPAPTGGGVLTLAVSGSTLYAGGDFTSMGGTGRVDLAAVDLSSGIASSWDPAISAFGYTYVDALAVSGSTVYFGGQFGHVGGLVRLNGAAVDASNAAPTAWDPQPNGSVSAIQLIGSTAYLGGGFNSLGQFNPAGQQERNALAAVDTDTGTALPWDADINGNGLGVSAIGTSPGRLLIGGTFSGVAGTPTGPYAQLTIGGGPPADTTPPTISISTPTEGQHVAQGSNVAAVFTCDDADSGVASCTGSPTLDTSSPGTKSYTVTAADHAGNTTSRSVTYVVDDSPPSSEPGPQIDGFPAHHPDDPNVPKVPPVVVDPPVISLPRVAEPKLFGVTSILRSRLSRGISLALSGAKPKSRYTTTISAGGSVLAIVKGSTNALGKASIRVKLSKKALTKTKHLKTLSIRVRVTDPSGKGQTLRVRVRVK